MGVARARAHAHTHTHARTHKHTQTKGCMFAAAHEHNHTAHKHSPDDMWPEAANSPLQRHSSTTTHNHDTKRYENVHSTYSCDTCDDTAAARLEAATEALSSEATKNEL